MDVPTISIRLVFGSLLIGLVIGFMQVLFQLKQATANHLKWLLKLLLWEQML